LCTVDPHGFSLHLPATFVSFSLRPRPPPATLFPYTTLFRSGRHAGLRRGRVDAGRRRQHGPPQGVVRSYPPLYCVPSPRTVRGRDRKSTRLNSSHVSISYAVFCLKKNNTPE